jgi:predicted ferric reductase
VTAVVAPPRRRMPAPVAVDGSRARRDAGVRLGALMGLWASLLLVSYWWATGGGIQDLGSWASGLTSSGRLTGLLASGLLLVQVLLMSRLPALEHAFGQDELARLHRLVGFTSFNLMITHVGLITWGYAAGRLSATPGELWTLTVDFPGMLLAAAGTACLVMVVVTSIRAARRKLRYESWHLLHLYAYLGVGLALPHQLWTGQDFLASTARTVFWWGLWIAAAGAVLIWRVALPLWRSARYGLRVTAVLPEGDGLLSVTMSARPGTTMPAEAGQFFNFRFMSGTGWARAHPYSLSAAPDRRSLRITVKVVGDGSAALRLLRPGTRVLIEGPYGRLSARARTQPKVALIGAGVGITPLRALAEELEYAPGDAVLLYRYSGGNPLFRRELEALAADRGLKVIWLPGHRRARGSWLGDGIGSASDLAALTSWAPDIAERDVYVCGPEPWADDVRATTEVAGLPTDHFHVESFGW